MAQQSYTTVHIPHLTPQECEATNSRVSKVTEGHSVWPAWIVGRVWLLSDPLIPIVTITIERAFSITVDSDIITADYQGR
jgi:hypothetical protein